MLAAARPMEVRGQGGPGQKKAPKPASTSQGREKGGRCEGQGGRVGDDECEDLGRTPGCSGLWSRPPGCSGCRGRRGEEEEVRAPRRRGSHLVNDMLWQPDRI
jgi:hypothetical protein